MSDSMPERIFKRPIRENGRPFPEVLELFFEDIEKAEIDPSKFSKYLVEPFESTIKCCLLSGSISDEEATELFSQVGNIMFNEELYNYLQEHKND